MNRCLIGFLSCICAITSQVGRIRIFFSQDEVVILYIQQIPSPALVVGIYEEAVHYKIEANREQKREVNARFGIPKPD